MIQYRRLAALLLGIWLGAAIFADVAVTQNFQTVDRFLQLPGSVSASIALNSAGRTQERLILRRNAGEENNWIFLNWERMEFFIGGVLFMLLLFGERPQIVLLALSIGMVAIVAVQHFVLTPQIIELGRQVDDLPANDARVATFWTLHGFYSGSEILKLLVGAAFALRLAIKRKPGPDHFVREYEKMSGDAADTPGWR